MIGNMVGQVTEDATLQIIPQAKAKPVRPSLTPLNGAVITNFQPNASGNGYILSYTKDGQTFKVDYSWTPTGVYTYHFISPTGTVTETVATGTVTAATVTAPAITAAVVAAEGPSTGWIASSAAAAAWASLTANSDN